MSNEKALGLLGLCARAGRLLSGEQACDQAVKKQSAYLILIDESASFNPRKGMTDACAYYQVPARFLPAASLGAAIGRPGRMVCAVTDRKLAERLMQLLPEKPLENID